MKIISLQDPVPAEIDYPRADRLLSAESPKRITLNAHSSSDGALDCGTWSCEVGKWAIEFADHKEEFFTVIQGRVRLWNESGEFWEFGPGQAAVIPCGFKGAFEVLEAVTKHYVIYSKAPV